MATVKTRKIRNIILFLTVMSEQYGWNKSTWLGRERCDCAQVVQSGRRFRIKIEIERAALADLVVVFLKPFTGGGAPQIAQFG